MAIPVGSSLPERAVPGESPCRSCKAVGCLARRG
jgi:hypothetical protein